MTTRYLAVASAALATTGGFAVSNLAHSVPAEAATPTAAGPTSDVNLSAADLQAWSWGVEAGINPTMANKVNAFLTLNYDRKLHGLSYWGDGQSSGGPTLSEYVHQAQEARWFQGVLNGESSRATSAPKAYASSSLAPVSSSSLGGVWACIRQHESGGNYAENTGNGYYGAYQFTQQTWNGLGYSGNPAAASPATQDAAAQKLQAEAGWGQWPVTSRECGV